MSNPYLIEFNNLADNPETIVAGSSRKNAYIITMFGGDAYVIGAIACAKPLFENLKRNYDIIIQITNDVLYNLDPAKSGNREQDKPYQETTIYKLLKQYSDYVVPINYLLGGNPIHTKIFSTKPHYTKVWTKLISLRYENYEKICLIDADYYPNPTYIDKFNLIFDLEAPAACIEAPTLLTPTLLTPTKQEIRTEFLDIYTPQADLNSSTPLKTNNYNINPIIVLTQLYAQNKTSRSDGSLRFGGFNASLMLLKPSMAEFNAIKTDISDESYACKYRLFYFYPEQQYLSARYALPYNFTIEQIDKYINHYINSYLPSLIHNASKDGITYNYRENLLDVLEKMNMRSIDISNLSKNASNTRLRERNTSGRKYDKAFDSKLIDIINWDDVIAEITAKSCSTMYFKLNEHYKALLAELKTKLNAVNVELQSNSNQTIKLNKIIKCTLYSIIMYYILTERNENVRRDTSLYTNNSWTAIDTRYYICEFYKTYLNDRGEFTNVNDVQHYGYPLLQQNKLWTKKGIFSNNALTQYKPESTGYHLWFNELHTLLKQLYKPLADLGNLYTQTKYKELLDVYTAYTTHEPTYQNTVNKLTRRVSKQINTSTSTSKSRSKSRSTKKNNSVTNLLSRRPLSQLRRAVSLPTSNSRIPLPRQSSTV